MTANSSGAAGNTLPLDKQELLAVYRRMRTIRDFEERLHVDFSRGEIPGFARFLVLRGNGGSQGRVPFQSTDPNASVAIDVNVPAGSYSYVVVAVDGNAKTLVHSNPVFIQIGAAN